MLQHILFYSILLQKKGLRIDLGLDSETWAYKLGPWSYETRSHYGPTYQPALSLKKKKRKKKNSPHLLPFFLNDSSLNDGVCSFPAPSVHGRRRHLPQASGGSARRPALRLPSPLLASALRLRPFSGELSRYRSLGSSPDLRFHLGAFLTVTVGVGLRRRHKACRQPLASTVSIEV